jgi:hypothetical protein
MLEKPTTASGYFHGLVTLSPRAEARCISNARRPIASQDGVAC